ncbi:MAG: NAD-dependent epimerase/dehydratase family protein [Syntrophales bacterium]|nr:NAD-dependent epimerase/dehydratase family protein [Syntrophales bacterium]
MLWRQKADSHVMACWKELNMDLATSKVFITGATGFIGGRIAERLWLEHGIASRCLVQNFSSAARLSRLPVTMYQGNILDSTSLIEGVGNSNVIFHCAYGNTSDIELNRRINEDGLRHLGEVALQKGVERFLHLSTIAVYGPHPPNIVTEETAVQLSDDEYGNSKIRAESICRELSKRGLPIVIIRPAVVFGPFSPIWTVGAMKRVISGGWEYTTDIHGLCNPVYIDDLVDGLFFCVEKDVAVGESFILSGDAPVSWNAYYQAYKDLAGLKALNAAKHSSNRAWQQHIGNLLRTNVRFLRKFMEPQLIDVYERLKATNPALARKLYTLLGSGIQKNEKEKFNQETVYSIEKARSMLGYNPRTFAEGMKLTADWLFFYEQDRI